MWHCPARREWEGWPSLFDSVRLAQGLEATSFPLPAISPPAFVALPVHRGVDGMSLVELESAGIRDVFISTINPLAGFNRGKER